MKKDSSANPSGLDTVLSFLETELRAGVQHGFFDYQVTCEMVNDKKRRITIKAGKSHQFIVPAEGQS